MCSQNTIPGHVLDELCARFVINLPPGECQDVRQMFFHLELAHWFYVDHYFKNEGNKSFPDMKEFSLEMFKHVPQAFGKFKLDFDEAFESWRAYKRTIPTYGAILLDQKMTNCLLVENYWAKDNWGFPKGKINRDEQPVDCAIREVFEETGIDISSMIDPNFYLENSSKQKMCRLYVVPGVSMKTKFRAQTRYEITGHSWFRVDRLPTSFEEINCEKANEKKVLDKTQGKKLFTVVPFVKKLINEIEQRKQCERLLKTIEPYMNKGMRKAMVNKCQGTTRKERNVGTSNKWNKNHPSRANPSLTINSLQGYESAKFDLKKILERFQYSMSKNVPFQNIPWPPQTLSSSTLAGNRNMAKPGTGNFKGRFVKAPSTKIYRSSCGSTDQRNGQNMICKKLINCYVY